MVSLNNLQDRAHVSHAVAHGWITSETMSKSKIWSRTEWRNKRSEFVKDKGCQWCGSKNSLVIHHTKTPIRFQQIVHQVGQALLHQKVKEEEFEFQVEARKVCPRCNSQSIYKRTTISPKYRCTRCGYVFEKTKAIRVNTGWLSREDWNQFWTKYRSAIEEKAAELSRKGHIYYMSLEDCIVLCKKCHFAIHKGLVLCKDCGKKYHPQQYSTCWDCIPDSEWKKETEREHKKIETMLPCGSKVMVEAGFWEFGGTFETCLHYCPNNEDINRCDDFSKWYEEYSSEKDKEKEE